MSRADNLTTFVCRLSWNVGASNSRNPHGLSRPVMGLLYLYLLSSFDIRSHSYNKRWNWIQSRDCSIPRRIAFFSLLFHTAACSASRFLPHMPVTLIKGFSHFLYFPVLILIWYPNPVAARSKAWVCGRCYAGIVGSNPSDVCLFWVLCIVR